jgi:hypothetical protein
VSLDDWIKALHLLNAFALVAAMVVLWFGYLALRADTDGSVALARLFVVGTVAIQIGIAGTLVFGI